MTDGPNFLDQEEWAALEPGHRVPTPLSEYERTAAFARIRADRLARAADQLARALAASEEKAERYRLTSLRQWAALRDIADRLDPHAGRGPHDLDAIRVIAQRESGVEPFTPAQEASFAASRTPMARRAERARCAETANDSPTGATPGDPSISNPVQTNDLRKAGGGDRTRDLPQQTADATGGDAPAPCVAPLLGAAHAPALAEIYLRNCQRSANGVTGLPADARVVAWGAWLAEREVGNG